MDVPFGHLCVTEIKPPLFWDLFTGNCNLQMTKKTYIFFIGEASYECLQKAVDNRMIHEVSYTSWLICLNETSLDFQVQKLFPFFVFTT